MRRVMCFALSLILVLGMAFPALAAEVERGSSEQDISAVELISDSEGSLPPPLFR